MVGEVAQAIVSPCEDILALCSFLAPSYSFLLTDHLILSKGHTRRPGWGRLEWYEARPVSCSVMLAKSAALSGHSQLPQESCPLLMVLSDQSAVGANSRPGGRARPGTTGGVERGGSIRVLGWILATMPEGLVGE